MINEKEVIKTLQDQRSKDAVLDAVCTVFAARQRARDRVTIHALMQRMKNEGFLYKESDYAKVLKLLASLGLGKLDTDAKGQVRALRDVKVTLQSIGMAAVGQANSMAKDWKRNKFQAIPIIEAAPAKKLAEVIHSTDTTPPVILPRVQPRPEPGIWEVLCVPLKAGGTYKTYVPKSLTKDDAKLIGQALSDMAKS